jgi:hypothetical protein
VLEQEAQVRRDRTEQREQDAELKSQVVICVGERIEEALGSPGLFVLEARPPPPSSTRRAYRQIQTYPGNNFTTPS